MLSYELVGRTSQSYSQGVCPHHKGSETLFLKTGMQLTVNTPQYPGVTETAKSKTGRDARMSHSKEVTTDYLRSPWRRQDRLSFETGQFLNQSDVFKSIGSNEEGESFIFWGGRSTKAATLETVNGRL